MTDKIKLCKDCKHCIYREGQLEHAVCRAVVSDRDLVTGAISFSYCVNQRSDDSWKCGKSGRLWKAKE